MFAVLDGHSGDRAAEFCKKHIREALIKKAALLEEGADTCQHIKEGKFLCLTKGLID